MPGVDQGRFVNLRILSSRYPKAPGLALLFLFGGVLVGAQALAEMKGPHAEALQKLQFDRPFSLSTPQGPRSVICLSSSHDKNLIGIIHEITVKSTVENLVKIFENYENYTEIFDSLRKSKVTYREGAEVHIDFEGAVPFFLAPNSKYSMIYRTLVDHVKETQNYKAYSFTLDQSKDLKSLDGVSVIRKINAATSLYQEIDFLDAHWGAAKVFAPGAIWKDSLEEIINTDIAMKIRAEEPELPAKDVIKKAHVAMKSEENALELCLKEKIDAQGFLNQLIAAPLSEKQSVAPKTDTPVKKLK